MSKDRSLWDSGSDWHEDRVETLDNYSLAAVHYLEGKPPKQGTPPILFIKAILLKSSSWSTLSKALQSPCN